MKRLWIAVCACALLGGCNKEDGHDGSVPDMSLLVGKDWYYNGWMGNAEAFDANDLLQVVRFEKDGGLKEIEFGGRKENVVGTWTAEGNRMTLDYTAGGRMTWDVLHCGKDYVEVMVNELGTREYTTGFEYLGDLTADAFIVHEHSGNSGYKTYVGADVRGNKDVREVQMLLGDGKVSELVKNEYYWRTGEQYEPQDAREQEARFHVRIGGDKHLKLKDVIYANDLPERMPAEMGLGARREAGDLTVVWKPVAGEQVFYRVEVLPADGDAMHPYFIGNILPGNYGSMLVKPNTLGELNHMADLKAGRTYTVRLSVLLFEPGTDPLNDPYGYANLQAVSYYTCPFEW